MKCDSTCALATGTPQLTLLAEWTAGSCQARAASSQSPSPTGDTYTCVVGVCHHPVVANRGSRSRTASHGTSVRQIVVPVNLIS